MKNVIVVCKLKKRIIMAKAVKKKKVEKGQIFVIKSAFKTTKREYKVGDTIECFSQKEIDYLKSTNKI